MKKLGLAVGIYCFVIFWAAFCTGGLHSQVLNQSVQGLVTDESGAVVPGAVVSITNLATGIEQRTTTNATGNYTITPVAVGNYDIVCGLEGFQTDRVVNQRIETGAQTRVNFELRIGEHTISIDVIASAVTLHTEDPTVGAVIENKRVTELPLNGRNMVQLALLVPGVQPGLKTSTFALDGMLGNVPGQAYSVSANGVREMHQVVSLDGVDAKEPRMGRTNFVPSIEAIEEFKVQTNAYSAEFGFGGGAVTSITMKGGTNELHGTVFEFLRNDKLDAENYFLNFERVGEREPKDKLRRNQFGLVVSGPIVMNKTFWAFNWESRKEIVGNVQETWFPLDEFRNGDFSELASDSFLDTGRRSPILIFDALNGDPFPGNVVPQSRIHPGAKNLLDQFVPRSQFREADPLRETARSAIDQAVDTNLFFGRLDHYFSNSDRFFARLAWDESGVDRARINPNFPWFTDVRSVNMATSWVHTFSQNVINDFRFGFNSTDEEFTNPRTNDEGFSIDDLGIGKFRIVSDGNRPLGALEQGLPRLAGLPFDFRDQWTQFNYADTIQIADHVSMIAGSHNLKFGGEYHYVTLERDVATFGDIFFGSNESGLPFASYLLGLPRQTQTPLGLTKSDSLANRLGFYVQDDWKVAPRVTVNLGLRFDYNGNPVDHDGLWRTVNFCGEQLPAGRGPSCFTDPDNGIDYPTVGPGSIGPGGNVKLWRQDVRFFMPRVGIAFRPNEKWVIRTGAGYFDNLMHLNTFTILNLMPPKSASVGFNSVTDRAQTVSLTTPGGRSFSNLQTRVFRPGQDIITLDDPFLIDGGGTPISRATNTLHINPDYKDGDVWKWSFDIQRELPRNVSLTVGYVGSKSSHVGNSIGNWNSPEPNPDTNFQRNRPWQSFYDLGEPEKGLQSLGRVRFLDSYGNAFHHGLQAKLDKRYSNGLAFGVAYTYSKSHGDGEAGGQEGAQFQSPRSDRNDARGRFRFDRRHDFTAHYVWELPGQNVSGPLKHVIGGWQTNGILALRSGLPFTVLAPSGRGDLNVSTDSQVRPDLVGDPRLANPTRDSWFNPQAFARNTCDIPERLDLCHIGSAGYNILDSPGQQNLDFSLYKNFQLAESARLQLRSEFFNAFNTPYFGQPSGGINFSSISYSSSTQLTPDGTRDGEIRSIRTPMRIIQFGLKLFF